jgi:hypothetical protein
MKTLKYLVAATATATTTGWLLMAPNLATAEPAGAVFPGNEAVRIVNGKRVVEEPPLTAATQRYLKAGFKLAPPRDGAEVYMIEGPTGLMDCASVYFSPTGCIASTLGVSQRSRFWTVKLDGLWLHCESRLPKRKCEPVAAGVPGGLGTVE